MRLVLVIFMIAFSAKAENTIKPEDRDWDKFIQVASTNVDMKSKGIQAIKILDNRLDEIIQSILNELDKKAQDLLIANQEAWKTHAQTKCLFLADTYRGGTHEGLDYIYCYISEQVKRIAELKAMKKYRETP